MPGGASVTTPAARWLVLASALLFSTGGAAIKTEALQAILDEVAQTDPRAKKVKPQELIDSRYLDEMDKSGFMDQLWGKKKEL